MSALHPVCDRAIAQCARARDVSGVGGRPNLILATTILASSLAFIEGSVVNVGLPAVGRSFEASGASLAWVINGYLLPLSALLLLGGALGDLYGRRRLLLIGVSLFAVASVLCTAAGTLTVLLVGRVLQGVGAALLLPNSLAILGATFDSERRGRAIGIWAAAGAAAGAVGPLIGGWLIDGFGWRAIFLVNLPLAAATLFLAARFVPNDGRTGKTTLDVLGAVLATAALTLLTWALTYASSSGQLGVAGLTTLGGGILSLVLFVLVERRRGNSAMLPLSLFSSRAFTSLNVLTFLLYGALGGLMVAVPFVLIEVRHYSATAAAAALLPFPLVIALASPSVGRWAARTGPRPALTLGPLIAAAACVLTMRVGEEGSYWMTTFPALFVLSLGMAIAVAPLTNAVLGSVEADHEGLASGFNSAVARLGGLVATALLTAVLAAHGADRISSFRVASVVAAAACVAAALCAFVGIGPVSRAARTPRQV